MKRLLPILLALIAPYNTLAGGTQPIQPSPAPAALPSLLLGERVSPQVVTQPGVLFDVFIPTTLDAHRDLQIQASLLNVSSQPTELSFLSGQPTYWIEFKSTSSDFTRRCNLASFTQTPILSSSPARRWKVEPGGGLTLPCLLQAREGAPILPSGQYHVQATLILGDPGRTVVYWRSATRLVRVP